MEGQLNAKVMLGLLEKIETFKRRNYYKTPY